MKRRIQWFNNLPEEIRQKAISRTQEQLSFIDWHEEFISLELCLKSSFVLKETKEGLGYWIFVCFERFDLCEDVLNYKKQATKHEKNSAL